MKIAIVGIAGLPAEYGGFETMVENLALGSAQYSFLVYCSGVGRKDKRGFFNNAKLVYLPVRANGVSSILYDFLGLMHSVIYRPHVILILGVSGCVFLPLFRFLVSSRLIVNIDGLEWRREKWGRLARWYLKLSEKIAVRFADVVVCDNEAIMEYVKNEYHVNGRYIAYGGDHALRCIDKVLDDGYALSLCRIEPENNVEMILEAFKRTSKRIVFVGNWAGSSYAAKLKKEYGKYKNIELVGPIYDVSQLASLRGSCSYYVHGHSAGGTNPSLVEMMFIGKPIFCFDCVYNRATTENEAYYFSNINELILGVEKSYNIEDTVGKTMVEIAERKYRWDFINEEYMKLFSE